MQLFPCPFCGPRSENEFQFGGDAGNLRPEGFSSVQDGLWADYLHFRNNPKGSAREIWMHLTCAEVFVMERNTVTHVVANATALAQEGSDR